MSRLLVHLGGLPWRMGSALQRRLSQVRLAVLGSAGANKVSLALARSRTAREQRVAAFIAKGRRPAALPGTRCDCCLRLYIFVSPRGWCVECEDEFKKLQHAMWRRREGAR